MLSFNTFLTERSQQSFQQFYSIIEATTQHIWKNILDVSNHWKLIQSKDNENQKRDYLELSFTSSDLDAWMEEDFKNSRLSSQYHLPKYNSNPLNIRINIREHDDAFYCSGYVIPSPAENTLVLHIMLDNPKMTDGVINKERKYHDLTKKLFKNKTKLLNIIQQDNSSNSSEIKSTLQHELTHIFQKSIRYDFDQTYSRSINYEYHWLSDDMIKTVEEYLNSNKDNKDKKPSTVEVYDYLMQLVDDDSRRILTQFKRKALKELEYYINTRKRKSTNDWHKSSYEFEAVLSEILLDTKKYLSKSKHPDKVTALEVYQHLLTINSSLVKKMLKMRKAKTLQAISRFISQYHSMS